MAQNSILLDKSLLFAARIVKLNKYLTKEKKEHIISKQISTSAKKENGDRFLEKCLRLFDFQR